MTFSRPAVSLAELLPWAALRHPDRVALITSTRTLTYAELDALSNRVASALRDRGFGVGDVVSLFGQNSWQWIVAYHGVLKVGGVVNPINVMLTGPELNYVLNDCGARGLFLGADEAERVGEFLGDIDLVVNVTFDAAFDELLAAGDAAEFPIAQRQPRDLGSIGYTSGTTGHPKGAMQSLESVLLNCAHTATMHGKTHRDVILSALPAAHVYGNVAINGTFLAGGTVVLMERFDPGVAFGLMAEHGVTVFEGVPAMYSMLLAAPDMATTDLSGLRVSTVGGQTFSPIIIEQWEKLTGAPLLELWGMTELSGLGTTHSVYAPACPGSIGVSLPGNEIAVAPIDGSTDPVPMGEAGELMVRGPLVMLGYHGRPEATAEVLSEDGWLRTGDVAYQNDSGHAFIVDRLKDMIITAGYNVYPAEIERVVAAHPDVAMVAIGRRPDAVKGEIAVAYVVLRADREPDKDSILAFCVDRLAAYKRPRDVVFVDQLPTTSSGKLLRRKLSELDSMAAT
ncbi:MULTISPECIES: AMP-binding protein [unclassified Gordonia (in: high G+C Gram-positive bacteria)]|uniref:class I adenylate-forming enzyme family protein n=1 Tax=unclassified Gordonia (in: high G+C Gram-positive bacteria) TaxID=2657482 RepID=UPI0009AD84AE|nr:MULTISPECIES: AMP-binding protein [unclassified Gordonia (in: high G+C Gram-positive bacteria)]MDF3281144.1 AMP-binding protein [Gordonia sp. N1V]OPX06117.1 fatty-acid--CoA ligase [Gordonia sp. i37]